MLNDAAAQAMADYNENLSQHLLSYLHTDPHNGTDSHLHTAALHYEICELRRALHEKDDEICRLTDIVQASNDRSHESSVDGLVGSYLKQPFADELKYWKDMALASSRGLGRSEGFVDREGKLGVWESRLQNKEKEIEVLERELDDRLRETNAAKHAQRIKEGQVQLKETQLKMAKDSFEAERLEFENRVNEHAQKEVVFSYSATSREENIGRVLRDNIEESNKMVMSLEDEIGALRESYLRTKRTEADLSLANQACVKEIDSLNNKLIDLQMKMDRIITEQNQTKSKSEPRDSELLEFFDKLSNIVSTCKQPTLSKTLLNKVTERSLNIKARMSFLCLLVSSLASLSYLLSQVPSPSQTPLYPPILDQIQENPPKTTEEHSFKTTTLINQTPDQDPIIPKLLSVLKRLQKQADCSKRDLHQLDQIINAMLDGWNEPALTQSVRDTKMLFHVYWKICDAGGDSAVAQKKINASLVCLTRLTSSIGGSHLARAMKNSSKISMEHNTERTLPKHYSLLAQRESIERDEKALFLLQQTSDADLCN